MLFPKTAPVRLTGTDLMMLRLACFQRDKERCVECGRHVKWEAGTPLSGHMAHIKGRGRNGSDTLDNVRFLCGICHHREHNPKSVRSKR
jgi:5-methylcytosine-specific restriction endonuclease McrA